MHRTGNIRLIVAVAALLCAGGAGAVVWRRSAARAVDRFARAVTVPVVLGEFIHSVNETGAVESSSNIEVRCTVRSKGSQGTTILKLVPEGTEVQPGDFLAQLDDSALRDQLIEHQIQLAKDEAAVIQAEADLATARGLLEEFLNGTAAQEVAALRAELALAEENLRRAEEYLAHSRMLNRKGYVTRTQLEADQFAVEKARQDYELAEQKLAVYEHYTRARTEAGHRLEIQKQEANLAAAEFTVQLSKQRRDDTQQQIEACQITAPSPGTVIYATERNDRGDSSFVIEEGASVRDGQAIFFLPDPRKMQVRATVSESKINRVRGGQSVRVRLDSAPEVPLEGRVRSVSPYPLPRRWFQAPIEYEVLVDVINPTDVVRSGLRAKVEILVERIDQARLAPIASILPHADGRFVLVRGPGPARTVMARPVRTGSHNDRFVVIDEGVEPGEEVLIDPENYRELVTFPAPAPSAAASPAPASVHP